MLVAENVCPFGTTCMEHTSMPSECMSGVVLRTPFCGQRQGRVETIGFRLRSQSISGLIFRRVFIDQLKKDFWEIVNAQTRECVRITWTTCKIRHYVFTTFDARIRNVKCNNINVLEFLQPSKYISLFEPRQPTKCSCKMHWNSLLVHHCHVSEHGTLYFTWSRATTSDKVSKSEW